MLLVVVPTLDSFKYLPLLLASLQSQTWSNWRLLFVDGPSGADHRSWLEKCCLLEQRCCWVPQDPDEQGIFGAMNQGFLYAANDLLADCWLLFWGSDDWAASPFVFQEVIALLNLFAGSGEIPPDLLVCRGRYSDAANGALGRPAAFHPPGLLVSAAYRRALLLGSTPPHQATLFGPGARQLLAHYASGFRLSADLDYFLQLSRHRGLRVQCLELELVHMGDGGISGQQTQRRLKEVRRAYRRAFGWRWWFPFLMRYLRRIASLLAWSR